MFSNHLYVLGMLGAIALSIQFTDAGDSHLQQTYIVEESSAKQPGRFRRGMHHVKEGIMHALDKVSGGRLGHKKDKHAEKLSSSSEEVKNTPVYVNQYEPYQAPRAVETTITVPLQTPPHASLSQLMDESDVSYNHDDVQLHQTQVVYQPMPVAHPSKLDGSFSAESAVDAVEMVETVDEVFDNASASEAYEPPIAYPTEVDASDYYEQSRDYGGPPEVTDGSNYVGEDQSDVGEVVAEAAVNLLVGSHDASDVSGQLHTQVITPTVPDASEYYEQSREYSGPLDVIDGSNYDEGVDQSDVLEEAVADAAVDLVAGSHDASDFIEEYDESGNVIQYVQNDRGYDGGQYHTGGTHTYTVTNEVNVPLTVLPSVEMKYTTQTGYAQVPPYTTHPSQVQEKFDEEGGSFMIDATSADLSEIERRNTEHDFEETEYSVELRNTANGAIHANNGVVYANEGAYANVPYTQSYPTHPPQVEEEFNEDDYSFMVDATGADLSEIERRNMEQELAEEAEYSEEQRYYAGGPQTISVH